MNKDCTTAVREILWNSVTCMTAHALSKVTGFSPQHINRVLKKMYGQGTVAYTIVPHRGRAQQKRLWCNVRAVKAFSGQYVFSVPRYVQLEMEI